MLLGRPRREDFLQKSIVGAALSDEALLNTLSAVRFALELPEIQRLLLHCRNDYIAIFPS